MYPAPAESPTKSAINLAMLAILIVILAFVATWTGVIRCSVIPGGCNIWWSVFRSANGGKPLVLIVHGETDDPGLGNPEFLKKSMADPNLLAVRADDVKVERVTKDFLKDYDLVIVTKAKIMPTEKMQAFIDYVAEGGRLVWTGDAGTMLDPSESPGAALLMKSERPGEKDENVVIGPWARKDGDYLVALDDFISAEYVDNYCNVKTCKDVNYSLGYLEALPGRKHPLVEGIRDDLEFYGDFAIVEPRAGNNSKRILTLKYGSELITKDKRKLGKEFPIIITSGVGGKVVYYATPLEYFFAPGRPKKYYQFIEDMYKALLY